MTSQTVALAKQIIDKVPAGLAMCPLGNTVIYGRYIGTSTQIAADIAAIGN